MNNAARVVRALIGLKSRVCVARVSALKEGNVVGRRDGRENKNRLENSQATNKDALRMRR